MKRLLLILCCCCCSLSLLAQRERTTTVRGVRGEYELHTNNDHVTMKQASELALANAKRRAIEQVCGESIKVWDRMTISSAGESFNSLALNQVDGEIVSYKVVSTNQQPAVQKNVILFTCVIDAEVKRGRVPDPAFTAAVSGVKGGYVAGDLLSFNITSHQESYLNIFLMESEVAGYKLYPNGIDPLQRLMPEREVVLPHNAEFVIEKTNSQPIETNYLVFLFTKREHHYAKTSSSWGDIETWMAKIPNDEKYIIYIPINIVAQK